MLIKNNITADERGKSSTNLDPEQNRKTKLEFVFEVAARKNLNGLLNGDGVMKRKTNKSMHSRHLLSPCEMMKLNMMRRCCKYPIETKGKKKVDD